MQISNHIHIEQFLGISKLEKLNLVLLKLLLQLHLIQTVEYRHQTPTIQEALTFLSQDILDRINRP